MVFHFFDARKARFLAAFGLFLALTAQAAQPSSDAADAVVARYPGGSIQSEERANQALQDIEAERRNVDARYAERERACYTEFFATSCLQKAKEQRRDALTRMRPIEIEANTFKRRAKAETHEREVAERAARREAEAGRITAKDASQATQSEGADAPVSADQQARDAAEAKKRAENVRAYDKKVQAVKAHEREVAARKAKASRNQACTGDCAGANTEK